MKQLSVVELIFKKEEQGHYSILDIILLNLFIYECMGKNYIYFYLTTT